MTVPAFTLAKARIAAEEALALVRHDGAWGRDERGRFLLVEGDGVTVELRTAFNGGVALGQASRYRAAVEGHPLGPVHGTLVVRDEWTSPALVATVDELMMVSGLSSFREGFWRHEVTGLLKGIPGFVARDDSDDLPAAIQTIRDTVQRLDLPQQAVAFGVVIATRSLWTHSSLLPLVLAATVRGTGEMEIDHAPEGFLCGCAVKRLAIHDEAAFGRRLKGLLGSWSVSDNELWIELAEGVDALARLTECEGIEPPTDVDVAIALAAPLAAD